MDLQIGILISFIMYLQLFFRPIRMIADRFNTLQMGVVSSSRIFKLLASNEHIANEGSFSPEKVQGNVKLDQVWFAYKEEDYVLKDISFEVKKAKPLPLLGLQVQVNRPLST